MHAVPCTAAHLLAIDVPGMDEERELRAEVAGAHPEAFKVYARTLLLDGVPVACGGMSVLWPGVCEAWGLVSDAAKAHPKDLTRLVYHEMVEMEKREDMRRVAASVEENFAAGHRWIKRLGFEREGLLRNYGFNGVGNYVIYSRIR